MKNKLLTILLLTISALNAQNATIPMGNFRTKLFQSNTTNLIAQDINGQSLKVDSNNDNQIQISEALRVYRLELSQSQINSLIGIEFFTNLQFLNCNINQITNFDLSSLINLQSVSFSYNQLSTLNTAMLPVSLQSLGLEGNQLTTLDVAFLTNLVSLGCNYNAINNLNINGLLNLTNVICSRNSLNNLDLSNVPNLNDLSCDNNVITSLDLSNVSLTVLNINNNSFTNINLSNQTNLRQFRCNVNQITSLDVSNSPLLNSLICSNNLLTNIDLNGLNLITYLELNNNLLTNLDLSGQNNITTVFCNVNNLQSLIVKNGSIETVSFNFNPNLQYVCSDEAEITTIQSKITQYGYTNCNLNTYCSFSPGGNFYTIEGNSKLDNNINGCDANDYSFNGLKFSIDNGFFNGFLVPNFSGNYKIDVPVGDYEITPILQNPNYYTVTPTSITYSFPASASPALQDFCITPNGAKQDIEISILPITVARPGFNATYKVIYKNKGNVIVSGNLSMTFSDAESDFVSANPAINNQIGGTLYWTYLNLQPFETREITVVLNLNSPQENPALNSGDRINFEASIEPFANDEFSGDNIFEMQQTIVNSFDPNDKTCLEGHQIAPAKVGSYVHYLIRFENTGTFPAENIVVKDMIDSTKFDINSLIPTDGSHQYVTKIEGNKVEFIFENINLPFDDANNDGYVAFKIKTKSTLVLGNTFSNSANIYFDYNFPIITNTATTTVAVPLANNDFVFNDYLKIYPNPAKNVLTIDNLKNINISSISIYTILGQVIQTTTNPTKTIDVSELKSGNYFLKINSDKGSSFERFIKD